MILEIPFSYEANHIPPRARTERKATVTDTLLVNLRELPADRFPVAARWADNSHQVRVGAPDDLRWDGRHFYRVSWSGDSRDRVPALVDALATAIQGHERGAESHNPFRDLQKVPEERWHNQPIVRHADLHLGRVLSDNRAERVAALQRRANGVVLSGGLCWVACGEPAWHIPLYGTIEAEAVLATPKMLEEQAGQLCRADRLDEYAQQFLGRPTMAHRGVIEVLLPQALRLSPEATHLRSAVASALPAMAACLGGASRAEFGLFADLRDAYAAAPRGEVPDGLADAVRSVVDEPGCLLGPDDHRALLNALERWRKDAVRDADLDGLPGLGALR